MEQNFDTSFIPKRPIFKEEASTRRHEPIPVVTLIGFAVFFAALIITGLAFFFHQKETAAVQALASQLGTEKERFNPAAIEELKAVSTRLKIAKGIVDNHVSVSPLLDLLQDTTLKSVYYENFGLEFDQKKGYVLRLKGKVPGYGLLFAQAEAFRAEPKITDAELGTIALDERTGEVDFEIILTLSPEVMKYVPVATDQPQAPDQSAGEGPVTQ